MATAPAPPPGSSAPETGAEWQVPSERGGPGQWIKAIVTLLLYALVFYWTDVRAIVSRLTTVRLEYVAVGVLLYVGGQALSTWKWRLLLARVGLAAVRYPRLLAFYFIGMFFNLFLPTMVGGDAPRRPCSWSGTSGCSRCCRSRSSQAGARLLSTSWV